MKQKIIALVICICLILSILSLNAHADAITISAISAAAYAISQSAGINWGAAGMTAAGMQSWMEGQTQAYLTGTGQTLIEAFGSAALQSLAGKLVVGYEAYNGIKNLIDWLIDKFDIGGNSKKISESINGDEVVYNGTGVSYGDRVLEAQITYDGRYYRAEFFGFIGETPYTFRSGTWPHVRDAYVSMELVPTQTTNVYNLIFYQNFQTANTSAVEWYTYKLPASGYSINGLTVTSHTIIDAGIPDSYEPLTVPDESKAWAGTIDGASGDLDDLIEAIYDDVAIGDLDTTGEVIDYGPVPTFEPEPTWAPAGDILTGVNQIGEELQDIISPQIEGILEGVNDTVDAIDDVAEAVDELTDSLTDVLDVPTSEEIVEYKFDLRTLFPFCIPFDIARILQAFDGAAVAPHVQIPIVIQSINFRYTMDLDFSSFNSVAAILRQVELIAFALVLAFATSKVIRW